MEFSAQWFQNIQAALPHLSKSEDFSFYPKSHKIEPITFIQYPSKLQDQVIENKKAKFTKDSDEEIDDFEEED